MTIERPLSRYGHKWDPKCTKAGPKEEAKEIKQHLARPPQYRCQELVPWKSYGLYISGMVEV